MTPGGSRRVDPRDDRPPVPVETLPGTIVERWRETARLHAERIAIESDGDAWTYAELALRADAVAAALVARLGPEPAPVGLLLPAGRPFGAAILGALAAGKAYLALDPRDPPERHAARLRDAGIACVLTDAAGAARLPGADALRVDALAGGSKPPPVPLDGEAAAMLASTSGSTGSPRIVRIDHRALLHRIAVYSDAARLGPEDRLTLLGLPGASATASAFFGALLNGATLCPFDARARGPAALAAWLRAARLTVYHSVPALFRAVARATDAVCPTVRLVRLGGEATFPADLELFRRRFGPDARLMTTLGSTEAGIVARRFLAPDSAPEDAPLPPGWPEQGVEVVDDAGAPVAPGTPGRIACGGPSVARGYWRGDEEGAFAGGPKARRFLSGDLGVVRADGLLAHLGRVDGRVKVRGERVDPAEVEAALRAQPGIEDCAVVVETDGRGGATVVAYAVASRGSAPAPERWREAVRRAVPAGSVPRAVVPLARIPRNASGKVEVAALAAPSRGGLEVGRNLAPDALEAEIARTFAEALRAAGLGRNDDFFERGGDSLAAAEVSAALESRLGLRIPPAALFEAPTAARLAAAIRHGSVSAESPRIVALAPGGDLAPLFLVHGIEGGVATLLALAGSLPSRRPVFGLPSAGLWRERWPIARVESMADRYLDAVRSVRPRGPYLLAGFCMGGVVALEMAHRLRAEGETVAMLAAIDTPCPRTSTRWLDLRRRTTDSVREAWRAFRWRLRQLALRAIGGAPRPRWHAGFRRVVKEANLRAMNRYRPVPYDGPAVVFRARIPLASFDPERVTLLRDRALPGAPLVDVPGNHGSCLVPPHVAELAKALDERLRSAEELAPPRRAAPAV